MPHAGNTMPSMAERITVLNMLKYSYYIKIERKNPSGKVFSGPDRVFIFLIF
jgi:hypothetical protein